MKWLMLFLSGLLLLSGCTTYRNASVSVYMAANETNQTIRLAVMDDGELLEAFSLSPGFHESRLYSPDKGSVVKVTAMVEGNPESGQTIAFRAVEAYPAKYIVTVSVEGEDISLVCEDLSRASSSDQSCPAP